jgi:sirohydrochlorin cobaltochelatase
MNALLLVGHGSLRPGSGAAMLRLAARLRERGAAPLVGAGFLNYSQPDVAGALQRLVRQGATSVMVQPYFLVPGLFVRKALPKLLAEAQQQHPQLTLRVSEPFGDHVALAHLVDKRAAAVQAGSNTALVLVAHGSPDEQANAAVVSIAERLRAMQRYGAVTVAYLSLNEPDLVAAVAELVAQGQRHFVVVPYMLQLGGHVAEDLPALVQQVASAQPGITLRLAEHLGYDPLLADVILARIVEL